MITSYQITCSKVSAELFQKRTNNNTTTPNNNTTNNITNKKEEEITKKNIIREEEIRTNKTEEEIIREYFQCILDNVKLFNNFDVLGHLDYAVRYAPETDKNYNYLKYKDLIDPILETVIEKGKGIEINTAGIRKYYLKDVHPTTDIIKRYKELGGEIITVGSDAHTAGWEATDFHRAEEALKAAGFDYYCTFENRIATFNKF